jgi:transcriptional regulator with XRE-family HTH domain
MYSHPQRRDSATVQALRKQGGAWLKSLREARGLSQSQLARLLGSDHYTFISQLETGRGRIPPDRYKDWADALGVPPHILARELLRYYDPMVFELLFSDADAEWPLGIEIPPIARRG